MWFIQRPTKGPRLPGSQKALMPRIRTWLWAAGCLFAGAFVVTVADRGQQVPAVGPYRPILEAGVLRPFDTSQQLQMQGQQQTKANPEATVAERKKQLSDDSARLLKLAN